MKSYGLSRQPQEKEDAWGWWSRAALKAFIPAAAHTGSSSWGLRAVHYKGQLSMPYRCFDISIGVKNSDGESDALPASKRTTTTRCGFPNRSRRSYRW